MDNSDQDQWDIGTAIAESYEEFDRLFGADLILSAFDAICRDGTGMLGLHLKLARDVDQCLQIGLNAETAGRLIWMANMRSDPSCEDLLRLIGMRWVLARDHMLSLPKEAMVVYAPIEGLDDQFRLRVLKQMLYRGAAPDTE